MTWLRAHRTARSLLFSKEKRVMKSDKRRKLSQWRPVYALALLIALLLSLSVAAPANADYGIEFFDVQFSEQDATPGNPLDDPPATQAGSHPYALTTTFGMNYTEPVPFAEWLPDGGQLKDLIIEQVKGLSGDATAYPKCLNADFLTSIPGTPLPECPNDTAVGITAVNLIAPAPLFYVNAAVFNVEPPPGVLVRLGLNVLNVKILVDVGVKEGGEYNVTATMLNTPQPINVFGGVLQLWGHPADPSHNFMRGTCIATKAIGDYSRSFGEVDFAAAAAGDCQGTGSALPFLTLPTGCTGPALTSYKTDSWLTPGTWTSGGVLTHDNSSPPNPQGFDGCGKLAFQPEVEARASTKAAETGSGFEFNVDFHDEGLQSASGLAQSTVEKAVVTLPEGVTINPSVGEGLGVCTPADFDREALRTMPGEGCPNSSKIGTLTITSPLTDEQFDGSIYLAQQDDPTTVMPGAENPFDSLIAVYLVIKNVNIGVHLKLPLKVEPNPQTGQLIATLEDIPQLPFDHFSFRFREGQRAPLISPTTCGKYTTKAVLTPWANPGEPVTVLSSFEITEGINGGPCPPGGVPPFKPAFEAGALNNNAGSFSPFNMRLIRNDGEQDMTKFSSILPPGQVGSLAGVAKCSDAAVAIATSKTGREELASPSCPPNSQIGRTLAGAGVGGALTYVPGQLYLGGPYKGAPLSVISITPAVAGPFDAGTVAVRLGLTLNPKTAEVEVDGAASDPIPHILKGIVLKLRDLRVYVDRPNFIINPTSCDPSSAKATLFGSYLDVFNPADDVPVNLATRYQAANCLNLGFKPKLNLNLKGGTKRGGHPGLKALYKPRKGDANVEGLVVRLPRSAFLDQAHIRTICTRVQFASDTCPPAAQYGYIKAWTPLLEEPLEGPVWLRSSNHKLPDMVFDLHGLVDVEVATRIDSAKGGIRATVDSAPDAPLSKVELKMQGGKKGLIINSRNLCESTSKANVQFSGHNGKQSTANPVMRADGCGGKRKR
jgi:hypothetical protein